MSLRSHTLAVPASFTRATAIAALLGATMLASPLTALRAVAADPAPLLLAQATTPQAPAAAPAQPAPAPMPAPQSQATPPSSGATAATKMETVEQRITSLHAALQITPQQEAKWDRVAQVMRDNAAAMQKLVADRDGQSEASVTAVQDLREYEKFAQAHLTGLRKLIAAFDTLYSAMPAAQKKTADQVFQNFGHHAAAAHS